MKSLCLDTRIVSQFIRGKASIKEKIKQYQTDGYEIYTTTVNVAEIHNGLARFSALSEEKLKSIAQLFQILNPRPLDYDAAVLAGTLFSNELKGREIGWRDTFIAAIVLRNGKTILTNNEDHFRRVSGLTVLEYTS